MTLSEQLADLQPIAIEGTLPPRLESLADDSREVSAGGGFVAVAGSGVDGHDFAERAVANGAAVVFCQRPLPALRAAFPHVAVVQVDDTRVRLAALSRLAYGTPTAAMKVLGVTGTNGKTTTTWLLESMGQALGRTVGVVGTINHRYPGFCEPSINTTPGVLKLTRMLHAMVQAGVDWVAMEVSSHGLALNRLAGVTFDAAVWTNMRQDHLDFHQTFDRYRAAKSTLYSAWLPASIAGGKQPLAIFNAEDSEVRVAYDALDPAAWAHRTLWYGFAERSTLPSEARALQVTDARQDAGGWSGTMALDGAVAPFALPLAGRFNVLNALGAVSACIAAGVPFADAVAALASVRPVPGRLEALGGGGKPRVFVDYAHTPDALSVALETLRETAPARLWVVFGAGGDRDRSKRAQMGRMAWSLSDRAIVTNDNPRTEDPNVIAHEVLSGIPEAERGNVVVELDRRRAVALAVSSAGADDIVLVAGKGHEDYQIIGKTKHHMDDRELVADALAAWRSAEEGV